MKSNSKKPISARKNKKAKWYQQISRFRIYGFVIAFALVGSYLLYQGRAATPNATAKMGVFRGAQTPGAVSDFESWLGRPVNYTVGFYGRTGSDFSAIENSGAVCQKWAPTKYSLALSTAMLPSSSSYTLAAGARGDYNKHWKITGQQLVDKGCADIILRIGWEFNGKFFSWAASGKEADYAAYWRQIVTTLRSVPGQSFKFDWCPLGSVVNADVEAAYPGSEYVDIIGLDHYDVLGTTASSPEDRWNKQQNVRYGRIWQLQWAKDHGKQVSFPEWGISVRPNDNLGGGDNPYFIQKMYEWMNALPASGPGSLAYQAYFEDDAVDAKHSIMSGEFPNSTAMYKKLFGVLPSSTPGDTTPPSTPAGLTANASSDDQINLSWSASTDNKKVEGYDVYRNDTKISSPITTSFSDSGLTASTKYSYYVMARDAAGNNSAPSSKVSATTTSATPAPTPTPTPTPTPAPTPPPASTVKTSTFDGTASKYGSKTYSLSLPKAGSIKYSVASPTDGGGRYDVQVFNSAGTKIHEQLNAYVTIRGSFTITKPGTYQVKVKTRWWSSNSFRLNVNYPY
ncbi:hypothetical protein HY003_04195 [Candidatus Saccharibacteria bacterium]|nr:hypothetical protein [Candidatus Saccharibacteria bacterium]